MLITSRAGRASGARGDWESVVASFICVQCGSVADRLTWQVFSNNTVHIRQSCADCGKYATYVPMTEANLARVEGGPIPPGGAIR